MAYNGTYNNGFPATYQGVGFNTPSYQQLQQQYLNQLQNLHTQNTQANQMVNQQMNQQTSYDINWVQGEAGAKSWNVPAGKSVILMDSETNSFYIKTTDINGMPMPLRVFDYTERVGGKASEVSIDTSQFVTYDVLEKKLDDIISLMADKADSKDDK